MRFAYIDSNGNEVPIPSVDALALRIELGAITDDTQLYDAQADQWGPAATHEIFHTLSRSSGGDEAFVAPPPVAPPPLAPLPAPPEPAETEAPMAPDSDSGAGEPEPTGADASGLTLSDPEPTAVSPVEAEPESTIADAPVDSEAVGDSEATSSGENDELGFGALDLAPRPELTESEPSDASDDSAVGEDDALDGGFDFGDMDGGLVMEDGFAPPEDAEGGDVMDFGAGMAGVIGAGIGDGDADGGESSLDFSGGMELDTPMAFGTGGFGDSAGAPLDLETPMSEFTPEAPPAWMEGDAGTGQGDVMDFSSVETEEEGVVNVPLRDRRTPKNKPSAPKHRRHQAMAVPIIGAVLLLAVGFGGYAAWPALSARFLGPALPDEPLAFLPPISAELEPQMRRLADAALSASFDAVREEWEAGGPVSTLSADWLKGVYLANASRFDEVESFWIGMEARLSAVRAIDLATFDAAYRVQAASAGVSEGDAASMRERADSGFVAASVDRDATYDHMERLITAGLSLHAFLLDNEDNIEYVPASTDTSDPVLEASPATPEIREGMEDRIDTITGALAALGYLDQPTAEGLWSAVLARVQESGVR